MKSQSAQTMTALADFSVPSRIVRLKNGRATSSYGGARAEVHAALAHLGYGPDEIRDAIHGLPHDDPADGDAPASVEHLLRLALRSLAAAR